MIVWWLPIGPLHLLLTQGSIQIVWTVTTVMIHTYYKWLYGWLMSDRLFIISLTQPYKVIILFYNCRCVSIMLYECSRPLTGADVTHLQFLMNLIEKIMESVGSACVAAGRPSATLSRCVLVGNSPNGKGIPTTFQTMPQTNLSERKSCYGG